MVYKEIRRFSCSTYPEKLTIVLWFSRQAGRIWVKALDVLGEAPSGSGIDAASSAGDHLSGFMGSPGRKIYP